MPVARQASSEPSGIRGDIWGLLDLESRRLSATAGPQASRFSYFSKLRLTLMQKDEEKRDERKQAGHKSKLRSVPRRVPEDAERVA
jgi:hypothetical protein